MAELLKNMFSESFVKSLGAELKKKAPYFDEKKFTASVLNKNWRYLELKNRMHQITEQIAVHLNESYKNQISILNKVAPLFSGFTGTVFPNFVEKYGLNDEHTSLEALKYYTQFSTGEFAIRPFLKNKPELIEHLYDWSRDKNHHVRRLASEGCRPLLPWAMKLEQYVIDPTPIIPILETLKNDSEDYVYRSVANNLNDISKNQPALVLQLGKNWKGVSVTTDWVLKHALRTLLKKGDPTAMRLFGFRSNFSFSVNQFNLSKNKLPIGDSLYLTLELENGFELAKFRIEYCVSYLKKNGSYSNKVFQITEKTLTGKEQIYIQKKIDFKNLSTRKHYPGKHFISLRVNGIEQKRENLTLE